MKTFVSVGLEPDGSEEPTIIVFQAESEEDAVLAIAEETIGPDEIEDFVENGEPGEGILDYVNTFMLDDYPVIIAELKELKDFANANALDLGYYYEADIVELLVKKYPEK